MCVCVCVYVCLVFYDFDFSSPVVQVESIHLVNSAIVQPNQEISCYAGESIIYYYDSREKKRM